MARRQQDHRRGEDDIEVMRGLREIEGDRDGSEEQGWGGDLSAGGA
jgi:hypothetical protein